MRMQQPGFSFDVVQFFEFVRLELERELRGEINGGVNGAGGGVVDPALICSLKLKVSAEFEKARRSFEEEMDSLKRSLKV